MLRPDAMRCRTCRLLTVCHLARYRAWQSPAPMLVITAVYPAVSPVGHTAGPRRRVAGIRAGEPPNGGTLEGSTGGEGPCGSRLFAFWPSVLGAALPRQIDVVAGVVIKVLRGRPQGRNPALRPPQVLSTTTVCGVPEGSSTPSTKRSAKRQGFACFAICSTSGDSTGSS